MSTTTANLGLFKYDTTNPTDLAAAFNINQALNNNWDIIDNAVSNSGSARNIGEIVASTIPLTDVGLHLLDGALINGSGIYSEFVTYIKGLRTQYFSLFTTESDWQASITQYGVCGKFVYDSTNNTVRLPKYSNKIWSGGGTAPVIGNGISLGLTDGINNGGFAWNNGGGNAVLKGPIQQFSGVAVGTSNSGSTYSLTQNVALGVTTDPTKSGLIADLSGITTSLDGYYYIVVATSTKTDIQVDIDNITTDLNGKADADLSNVPSSKGILTESYINGSSWYRVYADGWCEQGGISQVNTNTKNYTVNLLKAYKDIYYNLSCNQYFGDITYTSSSSQANFDNVNSYACTTNTRTTSSFRIQYITTGSGRFVSWQTCGYIN